MKFETISFTILKLKQRWIHGDPVGDIWAGAVMQKLLAILEIFWTNRPTLQGVESRVYGVKYGRGNVLRHLKFKMFRSLLKLS